MSKNNFGKDRIKRSAKGVFLWLRGYYYHGSSYSCPSCNRSFRTMLPGGYQSEATEKLNIVGAGLRNNNICPFCLSTDRDRLILLYLRDYYLISKKSINVLHVSPEPALYRVLSRIKNLNYTIGTKYAEGTYYPKEISFFDLRELPYSNATFDLIICNHVLEHIEDDRLAMSELYRVLKNNGQAILQVPISEQLPKTLENPAVISPADRHKIFGQFDHVRVYGSDYITRLESIGFKVEIIPSSAIQKKQNKINYALNSKEKLYIAHKML